MPPEVPVEVQATPWYKNRWAKWVAIVVAVAAALLIIGLVIVTLAWNSSPQKALLDAADYALHNPGTYRIESGSKMNVTVTVSNDQYELTGTLQNTPVDIIVSGSTVYAKSSDPQKLYEMFIGSSQAPGNAALFLKTIWSSLKNRWVSLSLQNISSLGNVACSLEARDVFTNNDSSRQQLANVYIAHPFLDIAKSSRSTYKVSIDSKKLLSFYTDVTKISAYQSLAHCSDATDLLGDGSLDVTSATLDLSSANVLKTMTLSDESGAKTKVTADYTKVQPITIPADVTDVNQVINNVLQSLLKSLNIK